MKSVQKLTLAALFLALGLLLPFLTGQIQYVGSMLLPMHIPVLLCGLICGWKYGLAVGFATPLVRSALFGMPVLFPMAFAMAFELAAYGAISGLIYNSSSKQDLGTVYQALISAMIGGRLIYGLVMTTITSLLGQPYSFQIFMNAAIMSGLPGIVLQLLLIPTIMLVLNKTGVLRFQSEKAVAKA